MSKPQDEALHHILTSAQLPTLPTMAIRLLELTSQEDVALADIVDCIAQDMALSAKILKVANSSFYSFQQQITTVGQAVTLLGINAVRSLVLNFTFLSLGKQAENSLFNLEMFWERSLVGATAAKMLATHVPEVDPDTLFTIGLLQNIGQLIFALTMPVRYNTVLEQLAVGGRDVGEAELEEEVLALSHTDLGAEVAKAWGLPSAIMAAIRHHHAPETYAGGDPHEQKIINIVFLSDLVTRIFYAYDPQRHYQRLQDQADRLFGLDDPALKNFLAIIHSEIARSAHFLEVPINSVRPVPEIIQEANIRLSMLQHSYEEMHRELIRAKQELEVIRKQLIEKNLLLERLVNIDGLTEIYNHRYFQTFLSSEINRAMSKHGSLSIILADIDYFKQFNDDYGHQTGDFILKELCVVAKKAIRQYDLMARYGGEEFVFVLPETSRDTAMIVANRLCHAIADNDFNDGYRHFRVTVSLGVASAAPVSTGFDQNEFIAQADRALYKAKHLGRNQAVLYQLVSDAPAP
ncbi:GGDEF domain-containing protein [Desulfobulbus sp.]|uniref:sensor domain-containing diguanylate cyclase n=1 Tax=Desulfobulbus sp. TaxID=895 RepID=UPI00286F71D2|nr:GGDEF domain-containing protein [Desulfobulbus sp.]